MRDELDFSDIPYYEDNSENVESSSSSSSDSSSIWSKNSKPFGLKSTKLNIFIDLMQIKTIKDLIIFLTKFQLNKNIYFNEMLLVLNEITKNYLNKPLKDILKSDPELKINWFEELDLRKNITEEDEEEIVIQKKFSGMN